jgi:hypothetical protein
MNKIIFTLFFFAFAYFYGFTQDSTLLNKEIDKMSYGAGVGLDFGGFGANMVIFPTKNIGLFFGGGYAIAGIGLNTGTKIRFIPSDTSKRTRFFIVAMYGYNAAIKVKGTVQYNKLFYGPSIGLGFDSESLYNKPSYWSFTLFYPFRSPAVEKYINDLKFTGTSFKNKLLPISLSLGYHFMIN